MIVAFLSQLWVQRLGWTLMHFLWQGTAIAILYAALRGLLGRSLSAQGRYVLACVTLVAMTMAPPLTFLLVPRAGGSAVPMVSWDLSAAGWQQLLSGVVAAWLLGVVAFSIRLFGAWRFTARLRTVSHPAPAEWQQTLERIAVHVGASRPVRLLVSSLVEVPVVIGWLRPVILLPVGSLTGLPVEHVTALLAHELAHIRRHDYLASILQSLAEAVLFYHPAVWWVSQQIRAERELCCDDLAVAASGDVLTYACALAELESQRTPRLRPALAANGGSLVNRVRRLIEPSQPITNNLPGPGAAWAMSLLWLAGVGVATIHAAQTPEPRMMNISPIVQPAEPSPAPAQATSPVLNAFLYDPFLPAPQAAQTTPNSPAAGTEEKKIRVEGRVISQTGEAVPRAIVELRDGRTLFAAPMYFKTSDDAGRFVFDDVAPGRYTLQVTRVGFLTGAYGAPSAGSLPVVFTLEAGQTMKDVVVKLTPQGVITGQLTNQDGDPVAHAAVTTYKVAYVRGRESIQERGSRAQTDDEGKFRIAGLTPGRYYIDALPQSTVAAARAASPPATADVKTMYPSALDAAGATPLEVAPGARLDRIDIRLRRERIYSMKGKVTLNGTPVEARVSISPKNADISSQRWGAVTSQGAFEVRGLPAGRYELQASLGNETQSVVISLAAPPPEQGPGVHGRAEVTVAGSNLEGVVVALEPDPELGGTFQAEDGELQDLAKSTTPPEPSADPFEGGLLTGASVKAGLSLSSAQNSNLRPMVRLFPDDGSAQMAVALMKDDGTFRISGPGFAPGRYLWDVTNLADSIYVKSVRHDGVDVTRSPIDFLAGGKLEIVLSGKAGSITGTLHNDKNEPLNGVTVTVWSKNPNPGSPSSGVKSRSTDQKGNFKIGGLAPGEYYVVAWEGEAANSGLVTIPDFLASFTSEAATVTLGESSSSNADVKLISRAKIAAAAAKLP